jgi:hypothetical protein
MKQELLVWAALPRMEREREPARVQAQKSHEKRWNLAAARKRGAEQRIGRRPIPTRV